MPSFFDPPAINPRFVGTPSGAAIATAALEKSLARPASLMDVPYNPPDPQSFMGPAGTNPKGTTPEGDGFPQSQFSIPRANAILSDRNTESLSDPKARVASLIADPTSLMGVFSFLTNQADQQAKAMAHSYLNSLMGYPSHASLSDNPAGFHSKDNPDPANIGNQATRAAAEAMMGQSQTPRPRPQSLPNGGVHGQPTPVGMPHGGVHGPF